MKISDFVNSNDVEYTKNCIESSDIIKYEEILGVKFGSELKKYISTYGYLAYGFIELYGINSVQNADSDMVKQTSYLHRYFPKTKNYIALGNMGDGCYVMVDNNDNIYYYYSDEDDLVSANLKMFDYIIDEFKQI